MSGSQVKNLESAILQVCESHGPGVTDKDITAKLGCDTKAKVRISVYNKLLAKGRIRLAERITGSGKSKKRDVLYQWVSAEDAEKFKGLDASDRMVLDLVLKGGQNGVTKKDMKFKTNIQSTAELKQIVERLMSRGLIREIKSVQGANKRVYIKAGLEPSTIHTGGPWYNDDQEFDTVFIEAMYEQVLAFIKKANFVTIEQVTSYVAEIKLSNEDLSQNDIKSLMNTMLYDTVIEACEGRGDGGEYFRHVQPTPAVNHMAAIPCGSCPVFHDCVPGGVISPQTCIYMDDWLKDVTDW